jgi:hypothetical protein
MKLSNILFSSILLLSGNFLPAQGFDSTTENYDTVGYKNRRSFAAESIRELKGGILVVRLSTNNRKLTELERLANNAELKASNREKFSSMAETVKAETRLENRQLMEAFAEKYTFSEVLFMYDTSIQALKNGVRKGIFLNGNLEPDPSLSLADEQWLMAYYGEPISSGKTFVEGLVISDRKLDMMPDPFPSFVGMPTIQRVFKSFSGKDSDKDTFLDLVARLDKHFAKFLKKVERK